MLYVLVLITIILSEVKTCCEKPPYCSTQKKKSNLNEGKTYLDSE
jgi:hypothetical protein